MKQTILTRYVLGFMFDLPFERVALIRKQKPEWQAGLLNGIGGKIEPEELPLYAMRREFLEETGVGTIGSLWRHFCTMEGINNDGSAFHVTCFWDYNAHILDLVASKEPEQVEVLSVDDVLTGKIRGSVAGKLPAHKVIPNLRWLIPLAIDSASNTCPPTIAHVSY